ncbi:glycine betaine uptake BCCT transporter [Deinococcus xianganensis]|uniref:BCCT family transporter n=1 Tax=Deinococcus xianganensis TaxID=1507289 RepID=A0A6I4YNT7_9DEIO|nr:BCCT family transporter [Deinococcus xianganensis]MXV19185.1 BCCT family transporter [Deinococcus xianganensis]
MVLVLSIVLITACVLWGLLNPAGFGSAAASAVQFTTESFGWYYLLAVLGFLLFCAYLAFSRHGQVRLGRDDERPEFSRSSWFAMLFSAGMGIGLVFWGVAEPVSHYLTPPGNVTPETADAARTALKYSFFHWGLHPWAIYSVVALSIAYFSFRRGEKALISRTFRPLLGDRVEGPLGQVIDVLAIIATIFGVAASLGFGAIQINSGLNAAFGLPVGTPTQLTIIGAVTVLYLLSASTGLTRGIQLLSNANMILAGLLLAAVFVLGPTRFLLDTFTTSVGGYVQDLISMSTRLTPFSGATWVGSWTLFYWAWWIAWAPFVGLFIARISRGRTIKEFVTGVLLVPSLVSFAWFSVFGGSALQKSLAGDRSVVTATQADVSTALFALLSHLPLSGLLVVLATLLIASFFITSADSATFVLGSLSRDGHENPPGRVKFTWGVLQSLIAVALLLSGGLSGLQNASIVAALPFSAVMLAMCVSLVKALREEHPSETQRPRTGTGPHLLDNRSRSATDR